MARLTEEMVIARSRQSDLSAIKKLNIWGAELGDVSILRRMPNLEVLALSINKIRSLSDVGGCRQLRELYIRKNEIEDLRDIRHLKQMPHLTHLWLEENPCTNYPEYRMTVLRNLPNLEKLDNVTVQPEEVVEAMRRGVYLPDSDEEEPIQDQDTMSVYSLSREWSGDADADGDAAGNWGHGQGAPRGRGKVGIEDKMVVTYGTAAAAAGGEKTSRPSVPVCRPVQKGNYAADQGCESPEGAPETTAEPRHDYMQGSDTSEGAPEPPAEPRADKPQCPLSPTPCARSPDYDKRFDFPRTQYECPVSPSRRMPPSRLSPDLERGYNFPPASNYEVRSPDKASLRHSHSAHSVKDYSYNSNGECRGSVTSPHQCHDAYSERMDRSEYQQVPQRCEWERDGASERGSARERDREYPSAVMAENRVFTRRPVTRNSNLLSAVLCLVKELDYPSLEVAEMAVRCRMDELANAQ